MPTPRHRDFAGLSDRFRPTAEDSSNSGGGYLYRPESVRGTERVLNNRFQSQMRTKFPKLTVLVSGILLAAAGCWRSIEILSLRGSQNSLVNNLLLVFLGAFLVFLSLHDRHVERARRDVP